MESLLHRPADPSPPDSQSSAASPSASMGSTYDIFGFMDLPFIVNSSPNALTDYSTTIPTSLHPPPSASSSSFNHALLSHHGMPQSPQAPMVAALPSNTLISSGVSSGVDLKFYHHFPPPWPSLGLPMSQPFDAVAAAATAAVANPATRRRGCRKRPRSSRRAPVTVMVTNRCNFRAMVQEFTGVPAPPFSPPTPPPPPPPATHYGVFHALPASTGWFSGDFDKHFPTLSSLLMPERTAPPGSGEMVGWRDSVIPGAEARESDSKIIFSNAMNI